VKFYREGTYNAGGLLKNSQFSENISLYVIGLYDSAGWDEFRGSVHVGGGSALRYIIDSVLHGSARYAVIFFVQV